MYSYHDSGESCPFTRVAMTIIDGGQWTARFIRNNNFRQHCHLLGRTFRQPHPKTDPLQPFVRRLIQAINARSSLMVNSHPSEFPVIPVLVRIAAYSSNWIREPETWMPDQAESAKEMISSLLDHLLVRWPVPEFFKSAWLEKGDLIFLERNWFCQVAIGGSLRDLHGMPPSMTSRALHWAKQAPDGLSIRQALRWGQVKSLGGGDDILTEVIGSRMVRDLSNDGIWSRLLEKVLTADDFDPRQFGLIVDSLADPISKGNVPRAQALVGLPLPELVRYSHGFWRSLLEHAEENGMKFRKPDIGSPHLRSELLKFNSCAWIPFIHGPSFQRIYVDKNLGEQLTITVEELTQYGSLIREGREMKNCVSCYWRKCREGKSAVFSLRTHLLSGSGVTIEHLLTIEVDCDSRRVVQAKGVRNRWVRYRQISELQEWARLHNLTL